MFERFTDRARRVVVLAQEEGRLLGHQYIGTEHLLLGLVRESGGVGGRALASLGIDLDDVRREVEALVGRGDATPPAHIPFTKRAKKVLEQALRQALQLGHNYIGTEHVLLGLVAVEDGEGVRVLKALGAEPETVRRRVHEILAGSDPGRPGDVGVQLVRTSVGERVAARAAGSVRARAATSRFRGDEMLAWSVDRIVFRRFTVSAARVLLLAESEALRLGRDTVGVAHLFLGLVAEGEGRAGQALAAAGIDIGRARSAVEQAMPAAPGEGAGWGGYDDDLLDAIERALVAAVAPAGPVPAGPGEARDADVPDAADEQDEQIDTGELLRGFLAQADRRAGTASRVLVALDLSPADVRRALDDLPPSTPPATADEPDEQGGSAADAGGEEGDDAGGGASGPAG